MTSLDIEVKSAVQKRRLIFDLTWPSLAEGFLASLVSMVDMMMVSVIGTGAINAVGLVTQPKFVLLAAFIAFNIGSTTMAAHAKGADDRRLANSVFNQTIVLTFLLSVVICTIMRLVADPFIHLIAGSGLSEASVSDGVNYYIIQIYGFPALALTFCINAVLKGTGNTRTSFYCNVISNLVNVLFNYCMIAGNWGFPRWGVTGASIATIIGQSCGFVYAVFVILSRRQYVAFCAKDWLRIDFSLAKRILNIGVPAFIEQIIMRVGIIIFTRMVTSLGDISYAAHMITLNIQQLAFTIGIAFSTAAATLTGQSLGRRRLDLAKVYTHMVHVISMVISILVSVFLFFGGKFIALLYTSDENIISLTILMLRIIAIANPISNARFVNIGALRGAGDSKSGMFISFFGVLLLRPVIGFALIAPTLPFRMGLTGLWLAIDLDFLVSYLLSEWRYRQGKWSEFKV
jgi:putative MATE family efflux protein